MTKRTENLIPVQFPKVNEASAEQGGENVAGKKPFVEPEVSFPVDVLEATTFFQLTDSGIVPPPPVP